MERLLFLFSLAGILNAQSLVVDKPSLTFSGQFAGSVVTQSLNVTSTGASIPFVLVAPPGITWLKINGQGTVSGSTPATVSVAADPTGLNAGSYTAQITLIGGATTSPAIPVTFTISAIGVNPASLSFTYTAGSLNFPAPQSVTLSGATTACTAQVTNTSGGNWFTLLQSACSSPGNLTFLIDSRVVSGLAPGTYSGSVSMAPSPAGNSPAVVLPLTLTVVPTPAVTVSPSAMAFSYQVGGANNITGQVLTINTTSLQPLNFSLTTSVDSGSFNWIATPIPSAGATNAGTGQAQVTAGVIPAGLAVGNYSGKITVLTPGGTPSQTDVPLKLTVSNTALLNVPSGTLNFTYQVGAGTPASQNVYISATSGTLSYAVTQSASTPWLSVPNAGTTATPLSVAVNPSGLAPGTYTATISVVAAAPGSIAQLIGVNLKVTNDPFIAASLSSLSFPFQIGQAAPAAQNFKLTSSTGVPLNYTAAPVASTCGNNWLQLNGGTTSVAGGTDSTLTVSVSPAGLAAGICNGAITVTATNPATGAAAVNSPLSIPVTLYVSASPLLVLSPATPPVFNVAAGMQSVPPQNITLNSTSSEVLNYTVTFQANNFGSNWLAVGPLSGTTSSNNVLTISVIPGQLSAGTYSGTVTVTATNPSGAAVANSPVTIPVALTVTAGTLTVSATALAFEQTAGGPAPPSQTVTVGSNGQPLNYTAVAATNASVNWLTVSPAAGNTSTSGQLTISADGSKLTPGATYTGTVTLTSPGAGNSPVVINVTLKVNQGTLSVPGAQLIFTQVAGGAAPPAQSILVSGSPGSLNFTVSTSTKDGNNWLTASPASAATPAGVQVLVNAAGLPTGVYNGAVTITAAGSSGSPITVPVVLTVVPPSTLSASPAALTFAYTTGQAIPPAQILAVSGSATGTVFNVQVQFSGPAAWLIVTPNISTVPANIAVSIAPTTLPPGTYNGSITMIAPNAVSSSSVQVTLTVSTIPKPVVNAIGNAASYSTGGVSPGENIVIFGSGVGPATLANGVVANNAFTTSAGNTRVLFDGVPAPVIYASATQTSVMVPYGIAGRSTTNIVVEYSAVQSNPNSYFVSAAVPGIYTLNTSGSGPGAIINQDGITVNSPNTPEKRGNVIAVYMTGEGQTDPQGADGAIIPAVASALKKPVLPVTATIGGVSAQVVYAGSAPGLVSGVMQVNLVIPPNAPTGGAVPVIVTVGTAATQTGANTVTLAIQ